MNKLLPDFDPGKNKNSREWITKWVTLSKINEVEESDTIKIALVHLRGDARRWALSVDGRFLNMKDFEKMGEN